MNEAQGDEKVPRCEVGERIIDRARSVWRIDEIRYREEKLFISNTATGHLKVITLDELWRGYDHYISWAEEYAKRRRS